MAHRRNPQALTALALLLVESAPANKDLMILLTLNLLRGLPASSMGNTALDWRKANAGAYANSNWGNFSSIRGYISIKAS